MEKNQRHKNRLRVFAWKLTIAIALFIFGCAIAGVFAKGGKGVKSITTVAGLSPAGRVEFQNCAFLDS